MELQAASGEWWSRHQKCNSLKAALLHLFPPPHPTLQRGLGGWICPYCIYHPASPDTCQPRSTVWGAKGERKAQITTLWQTCGFSATPAQIVHDSCHSMSRACCSGRGFTPTLSSAQRVWQWPLSWRSTPGAFLRSTVASSGLVCWINLSASLWQPSFSSRNPISVLSLCICFSLRSRRMRELKEGGEGRGRSRREEGRREKYKEIEDLTVCKLAWISLKLYFCCSLSDLCHCLFAVLQKSHTMVPNY